MLDCIRACCILVCAFAPLIARGQTPPPPPVSVQIQVQSPENTIETCSDGIDNDGDGYIDCADQDCQQLPNCRQAPPMYQPPPVYQAAPVYQPPPFVPYASQEEPPPYGLVTGIVGGVLLVSGLGMLFGSAEPWIAADCHSTTDPILGTSNGTSCRDDNARNTGIILDVLGGMFFISGVIMTPVGFSQFSNYQHWKKQHPQRHSFVPSLRTTPGGAVGGLRISF